MTRQLLPHKKLDDNFDRLNLSIIRKRFDAVNARRLQRLREALNTRHRLFIDVLAVMFHCNHPMFPGFVKHDVPCKIAEYKPSADELRAAKTIARSFTYKPELSRTDAISGIYVMGSVGTIAQSDRSDIDIWVCHAPRLSEHQLTLLKDKCDRISASAQQQRLEAHFFLMDYEQFKHGRLLLFDTESSGSAQRLLLLDEFYRSAIFIAGRRPLWWFVSEQNEIAYESHAARLLQQRFISPKEVLDFGGVAKIPEGEFLGAGIWQLYKAIGSPYKSVLKLLLLEVYVHEYPAIRPLALEFKQSVFDGELDIDKLDSYVMAYRRIENYLLKQDQNKRLELARRCFYFKVNRSLSQATSGRRLWQRQLLQTMVNDWGWNQAQLTLLDNRKRWKIAHVASERTLLVRELNHSYQFLIAFAQRIKSERSISANELTILGRKLQAAFERKPGKIEWINPNISKNLAEDIVAFDMGKLDSTEIPVWTAYTVNTDTTERNSTAIRSSNQFIELLLWCYYNGIIIKSTYLDFSQVALAYQQYITKMGKRRHRHSTSLLGNREANKILAIFSRWLPNPHKTAAHINFSQVAKPTRVLMLLNVGTMPDDDKTHYDYTNTTSSGQHDEARVTSVDIISTNSWNEVFTRRFNENSALLDALVEYLQMTLPNTHHKPPELQIDCLSRQHSRNIEQRVKLWFDDITACFYAGSSDRKRYLFRLSKQYYLVEFDSMRPVLRSYTEVPHILHALGDEQKHYSALKIDRHCLNDTVLPILANKMRRNVISVFYRRFDIGMEVYVADEKGSITHNIVRGQRRDKPLEPLHRFLRAAINRQARSQPDLLSDFGICPIYFYEIHRESKANIKVVQKSVSQNLPQNTMFDVKAVAYSDNGDAVQYDFYCDDQQFSSRSFQDQLFLVVAQFVLSRRRQGENYPIYITDLDLSLANHQVAKNGALQISHYLKTKKHLETKLNEAIGILSSA